MEVCFCGTQSLVSTLWKSARSSDSKTQRYRGYTHTTKTNQPILDIYVFNEDEHLVRLRNLNPEACNTVDLLGIDEVRRMKYLHYLEPWFEEQNEQNQK